MVPPLNKPSQRKSLAAARPVREPAWATAGGPDRRPPRRANFLKISQNLYCRNYCETVHVDSKLMLRRGAARGHAGQAGWPPAEAASILHSVQRRGRRGSAVPPAAAFPEVKVGVSSTRHLREVTRKCHERSRCKGRSASLAKGRRENWFVLEDSKGRKELP